MLDHATDKSSKKDVHVVVEIAFNFSRTIGTLGALAVTFTYK